MYMYIQGAFQDTIDVTQSLIVPEDMGRGWTDNLYSGFGRAWFEPDVGIYQWLRRVKKNSDCYLGCETIARLIACGHFS